MAEPEEETNGAMEVTEESESAVVEETLEVEKPENDGDDNEDANENASENANENNGEEETENMDSSITEHAEQEPDKSDQQKNEDVPDELRMELGGLPKNYLLSHLKKLLNTTLQLEVQRVKPVGMGRNMAFLDLKDVESKSRAMTILTGYKWQGATLTTENFDRNKDPTILAKIDCVKVPKKEHEQLPLNERIQKAVTPYHEMSYEDQLKEKEKVVRQVLRKYGNELAQMNPELKDFVHWHKIRRKGQICELDDFVQSPVTEGYLNKCDLVIGKNKDADHPVVGFRVASYKEGLVEIGPIDHLTHINEQMKQVVKLMEQYLSTSKHEAYDPFSEKGVWRQLTIRTTRNDDVMIIIVIHPQEMGESEITDLKEDIISFFTVGDGTEGKITSIFIQQYAQKESGKDADYEHIYGKTYIEETILGKRFKAAPDAFLQANTAACEILYEKITELTDIDQTAVLLDICSGVGTIGITLAESSYKVMGVELTASAVENAKANAEANGIANVSYINGKAEDLVHGMIEKAQRANTIAIVDPPKGGLSGSVMNALRKCEYLDRFVYVSSDPQAAVNNFQALGRPKSKTYKGTCFIPIRSIPIDMFPGTANFTLVILFERFDEYKWERIMGGNPRPKDQAYYDRIPELVYDPEKDKEREEKRKEKRAAKRRDRDRQRDRFYRDRNRRDRDGGDRDRGGRRDRDSRRDRDRDFNRNRDRGGGRNWSGGRDDGHPRDAKQNYGSGFQEGFQAAMEAIRSQNPGFVPGGAGLMGSMPLCSMPNMPMPLMPLMGNMPPNQDGGGFGGNQHDGGGFGGRNHQDGGQNQHGGGGGFGGRKQQDGGGFGGRNQQDRKFGGRNQRDGGRNQRDGGFGGRNKRDGGGFGGRNQQEGGFGGRNQQDGGFGGRNQQDGGFGGRNQQDGGFGGRNQQDSGFGGRNQQDGGFGGRNQQDSGYGNNNQQDGGFGNGNPQDIGFGNVNQQDTGFGNSNQDAGYGTQNQDTGYGTRNQDTGYGGGIIPTPAPQPQGDQQQGYSSTPSVGNQGGMWAYEGYGSTPAPPPPAPTPAPTPAPVASNNQQGTWYGYQTVPSWGASTQPQAAAAPAAPAPQNQMGSWGQTQYQTFEEPAAKKWKSEEAPQQQTGYDYNTYGSTNYY